ncbi:competence/damage-inducible protein A [Oceanomicrobium pacificus]|uniref:Competence/damage-inducible protein A n=1 Tax=Oceanomicrobium pacificus TaxID=2692916 RepID=A0A6B0TUZ5_9RHOB|nr:molybdopterin-binding protein [Oceanomicrobium pacificus]MXU64773.1 competence/damage-inducible protein A [Oceanomicrobium pacificus]
MTETGQSIGGTNPTAAMLVIGDEILSGRTRDANMHHLAGQLTAAGIRLAEVRVVADEEPAIVAAVTALRGSYDYVFTSGGIGPTHDDITADAIAAAFGVGIDVREDARAILATNYADPERDLNPARLRMARIPDGATLIDNPVSKAPGFRIGNVHVMAGVPKVFNAMLDAVLPTLRHGQAVASRSVDIALPEGELAGPLAEVAARHPALSIGSYPYIREGSYGAVVVVRGLPEAAVEAAAADVAALAP